MTQLKLDHTTDHRFWSKVDVRGEDECWEWMASKYRKGYGRFSYNGKEYAAHRFSYMINTGGIPDGKHVLHSCDNPSCVNPKHLSLGSNNDNIKQSIERGRKLRGSKHQNSKLTEEDVINIRMERGLSHKQLADKYGVSAATIGEIIRREIWKHI